MKTPPTAGRGRTPEFKSNEERRAYLRSNTHLTHPAFAGVETAAVVGSPAHRRVSAEMERLGIGRSTAADTNRSASGTARLAAAARASAAAAAPRQAAGGPQQPA